MEQSKEQEGREGEGEIGRESIVQAHRDGFGVSQMSLKNSESAGFLDEDASVSISVSSTTELSGSISSGQGQSLSLQNPSAEQRSARSGSDSVADMFKKSSHPVAAVFHVAFKVAALFLFMFGKWFSDSFVILFVLCIVCLAFDFWTVKNVTGRLMVGLRWWNEVDEDGASKWRFESQEDPDAVNGVDYKIFWYSMYLNIILWGLLGFFNVFAFNFDWLVLVVVAISLTGSNIYGYWQCSKFARQRLEGAVKGAVQQHAMSAFASSIGSSLTNAFSGAATRT